MTDSHLKQIATMFRAGADTLDIAKRLNVSEGWVYGVLTKAREKHRISKRVVNQSQTKTT